MLYVPYKMNGYFVIDKVGGLEYSENANWGWNNIDFFHFIQSQSFLAIFKDLDDEKWSFQFNSAIDFRQ